MESISVERLRKRLDNGERPLLLDVRETWEYDICRIENSINIPMSVIGGKYSELDRDRETVVICHHGSRSLQVAAFLEDLGFARPVNLDGGVHAWAELIEPDMPRY